MLRTVGLGSFFAISMGALLSRLPDLQEKLGVTESQLGLTLIGMSIGSLISLTLSAPLIEKLGSRTTAFVTVLGTALIYAIIPWLPSAIVVFVFIFSPQVIANFVADLPEFDCRFRPDTRVVPTFEPQPDTRCRSERLALLDPTG